MPSSKNLDTTNITSGHNRAARDLNYTVWVGRGLTGALSTGAFIYFSNAAVASKYAGLTSTSVKPMSLNKASAFPSSSDSLSGNSVAVASSGLGALFVVAAVVMGIKTTQNHRTLKNLVSSWNPDVLSDESQRRVFHSSIIPKKNIYSKKNPTP